MVTVTDCERNDCTGTYNVGGTTYRGQIPDTSAVASGVTLPILIDPSNPDVFFREDYVRSGRNAGFGPILVLDLSFTVVGIAWCVFWIRFKITFQARMSRMMRGAN